jgi:hypothetical protein
MTVKERIAKKKEALKMIKEVEKAKEAVKDEKVAAEEALENGTLSKKADEVEGADTAADLPIFGKITKKSIKKEAIETEKALKKTAAKEATESTDDVDLPPNLGKITKKSTKKEKKMIE